MSSQIQSSDDLLNVLTTFVEEMNNNNATTHKSEVFSKYAKLYPDVNGPFLKIIRMVNDDLIKFNVTGKNVLKFKDSDKNTSSTKKAKTKQTTLKSASAKGDVYTDSDAGLGLFKLLNDLNESIITGHTALQAVCDFIAAHPKYEDMVINIIDKNMKTRFTATNINKIVPNLIPSFEVSLGYPYDDSTKGELDKCKDWFISRKLDGVRCICQIVPNDKGKDGVTVTFTSRDGHDFDTLAKLETEIRSSLVDLLAEIRSTKKGVVLDGEVCVTDDGGKEDFRGIMKEIKKKGHTVDNPKYLLFDMLTHEEFLSGASNRIFSDRSKTLQTVIKKSNCKRLSCIEQVPFTGEKLVSMQLEVEKNGWEGLILRKNSKYQGKRTKDLLKVKQFFREEYKVKDLEFAKMRVINEDTGLEEEITTLKAVTISHKGFDVSVGSGFKLQERKNFYANPDLIKGKVISVQYFEETKGKKDAKSKEETISLRFPTFLGVYGEKRDF